MKIAFVQQPISTISIPAKGGSIELWIYHVARRLAKLHTVLVYSRKEHHHNKVECHQNVIYRRISTNFDRLFTRIATFFDEKLSRKGFALNKRPLFASKLYYLAYALQIARDLRVQNCDIVHIHNFSQLVPVIRAFNPHIKIVLHMHCEWLTQLDHKMIEGRLREVDLIIGCSNFIIEKIRYNFPQYADKCKTIYNGVDIKHFVRENKCNKEKEEDIKRLLFVGRISPDKGVHILIDAFNKVIKCYSKIQMNIVGPQNPLPFAWGVALDDNPRVIHLQSFYNGDYLSKLKRKLSSGASKVSFTGFLPRKELIKEFQNADIFIFPSVWNEPFGMPIVEAMATEVPVIATSVGGIPEIIEEGRTGILVEPNDDIALAESIIFLLINEDIRKSMGKMAYERAVNLFSWDIIAENLQCQYNKIFTRARI